MVTILIENQSWINFRHNSIKNILDFISEAVKKKVRLYMQLSFLPSMAKKMASQDWGNWS